MNSVKISENARIYIPEVKEDSVSCTYNGKVGCACGCLGKYSYTEIDRKLEGIRRGYEISNDKIRPKSIHSTIKKINEGLRGEFEIDVLIVDPEFVSIDVNGRTYSAYMRKNHV